MKHFPLVLALLCLATPMLTGCPGEPDAKNDPQKSYPQLSLGEEVTVMLNPTVSDEYSYTFEIPPQGKTRYDATLVLRAAEPGKRFRARRATTCAESIGEPDEVLSTDAPDGAITFRWSAESSTTFVQISSDEDMPFELDVKLHGALR